MDDVRRRSAISRSRASLLGDLVVGLVLVAVFWLPLLLSAPRYWVLSVGSTLAAVTAWSVLARWRLPKVAPMVALVATSAGWSLQVSSDPMLAVAWCLYPLALRRERWSRIIGGAAVVVMVLVSFTHGAPDSAAGVDQQIIVAAAVIGAVWLLGQAESKRVEAVRESADREAAYQRAVQQASMSREVHDVVGHALSVISAEADVSRSLPNVGEAELRESLGDIEQRARRALEEVQTLVRTLRNGEVGSGSVTPISQLVKAAQVSGLEVDTQVHEAGLSESIRRVVSRVVQEGLSNVVRHADARRCLVTVWREDQTVRVRVDDDGAGLSARYQPGLGLTGMRERVGAVGGTVTVTNRLEGGTRLLVIPGEGRRVSPPISVLLADDDADFRRVYQRLLSGSEGFRVVAEAGTGQDALRLITRLRPDVALVDVQMPEGSGLEVVRGAEGLSTRIIVLTAFDLDEYVSDALRHGAAGFLLKNASAHEVLSALRAVHAGHSSLAPEVTARLVDQFSSRPRPTPHAFADKRLSDRELQLTRLIAQGNSNQRIAHELHLSVETVKTYIKRLFHKLDVSDRTQLAVLAHEAGLLRAPR